MAIDADFDLSAEDRDMRLYMMGIYKRLPEGLREQAGHPKQWVEGMVAKVKAGKLTKKRADEWLQEKLRANEQMYEAYGELILGQAMAAKRERDELEWAFRRTKERLCTVPEFRREVESLWALAMEDVPRVGVGAVGAVLSAQFLRMEGQLRRGG
jgi:hypothetical protein